MTVTPIVFPDIAMLLIGLLEDAHDDRGMAVSVYGGIPNPRPTAFTTVRRTGGVRQTIVSDAPIVAFECWADSLELAHDIAQIDRAVVIASEGTQIDGHPIYRINELAGPAELPDPLSQQSRYTFTIQVGVRGFAEPDS